MLSLIRRFRTAIGGTGSRMDIVLFGGCIGSLFSFLQFISSPFIGSLSDRYGRKNVLLVSMAGNALSMLLWIFSKSFPVFVLSRVVGGLTEGNVQMSIAMISDITTEETRSRGLALVGIAFSLGFTVGPPLGAYFASVDLIKLFPSLEAYSINPYSSPALFAFVLIIIETVYMAYALPETLNYKKSDPISKAPSSTSQVASQGPSTTSQTVITPAALMPKNSDGASLLRLLSFVHFLFLFFFSGMEFTLTFLTHDRFHYTHAQQGKYLGFIGIITACVQGGYVRRFAHRVVSERTIAAQGMLSCALGLAVLGIFAYDETWLYVGATFLAFTSGTVVTSLTSLASLAGTKGDAIKEGKDKDTSSRLLSEHDEGGQQGRVLGYFRSMGQLGRAIGPLVACTGYWVLGSLPAYSLYACALGLVFLFVVYAIPAGRLAKKKVD